MGQKVGQGFGLLGKAAGRLAGVKQGGGRGTQPLRDCATRQPDGASIPTPRSLAELGALSSLGPPWPSPGSLEQGLLREHPRERHPHTSQSLIVLGLVSGRVAQRLSLRGKQEK